MNKISCLLMIAILASVVIAQPVGQRSLGVVNYPNPQMQGGGRAGERMEMMMTWKLTNDLDLTSEQADKFFPRLKEHRENMEKIENETYKISESIREKIDDGKEISAKEFEDALDNINELETSKIEERERFIKEMSEYLTTNQLAKLALFKHYFVKDLRQEIRNKSRKGT